jgi:RHS repeat-associated protein
MSGRFGYTGQMRLPELGLMHYKARAYSPRYGRFLQADPIGTNGGLNVYEYAGSDPVNASDPSGLSGCGSRTSSDSASCFSVIPPSYQNGSPGGGKPDEYGDRRPTGPGHWRRNIVNGLSSGWYYVGKGSPEMLRAAAGAQAGNENGTDELSEIVVVATKPKPNIWETDGYRLSALSTDPLGLCFSWGCGTEPGLEVPLFAPDDLITGAVAGKLAGKALARTLPKVIAFEGPSKKFLGYGVGRVFQVRLGEGKLIFRYDVKVIFPTKNGHF